jgi:hypothetical protein
VLSICNYALPYIDRSTSSEKLERTLSRGERVANAWAQSGSQRPPKDVSEYCFEDPNGWVEKGETTAELYPLGLMGYFIVVDCKGYTLYWTRDGSKANSAFKLAPDLDESFQELRFHRIKFQEDRNMVYILYGFADKRQKHDRL